MVRPVCLPHPIWSVFYVLAVLFSLSNTIGFEAIANIWEYFLGIHLSIQWRPILALWVHSIEHPMAPNTCPLGTLVSRILNIPLLLPDVEHEEVKFVMSKFGNALLVDKAGYMYYKTHGSKITDKIYWICCDRKKFKCFGRATTEGFYIVNKASKHNHASTQKKTRHEIEKIWKICENEVHSENK